VPWCSRADRALRRVFGSRPARARSCGNSGADGRTQHGASRMAAADRHGPAGPALSACVARQGARRTEGRGPRSAGQPARLPPTTAARRCSSRTVAARRVPAQLGAEPRVQVEAVDVMHACAGLRRAGATAARRQRQLEDAPVRDVHALRGGHARDDAARAGWDGYQRTAWRCATLSSGARLSATRALQQGSKKGTFFRPDALVRCSPP